MKYILSALIAILALTFSAPHSYAQSLRDRARQSREQSKELKAQEESRYSEAIDSRNLEIYEKYIADYPFSSKTDEIRNRANEIKSWNSAKATNTIPAYEKYLRNTKYNWFDTEANAGITELRRIAEKKAWEKVAAVNTLDAYNSYLKKNPGTPYRDDAEHAIRVLRAKEEWPLIAETGTIEQYRAFIAAYPDTDEAIPAGERVTEWEANELYKNGKLAEAYDKFTSVKSVAIRTEYMPAFRAAEEYNWFSQLSNDSRTDILENFMNKYPNSPYMNDVRNYYAVALAKQFDKTSTDNDYDRALSYAGNSVTKAAVNSNIERSKHQRSAWQSQLKAWEREDNGGAVQFGIEFTDWGFGKYKSESTDDEIDATKMYYNVGLMLRFGNYNDWIQCMLGIKPGVIGYMTSGSGYEEEKWKFHMPAFARLKLNVAKTSDESRFYLMGDYQYNLVREELLEGKMSWAAGVGFAWKHVDLSVYYRRELQTEINNPWAIGISATYFIKL